MFLEFILIHFLIQTVSVPFVSKAQVSFIFTFRFQNIPILELENISLATTVCVTGFNLLFTNCMAFCFKNC